MIKFIAYMSVSVVVAATEFDIYGMFIIHDLRRVCCGHQNRDMIIAPPDKVMANILRIVYGWVKCKYALLFFNSLLCVTGIVRYKRPEVYHTTALSPPQDFLHWQGIIVELEGGYVAFTAVTDLNAN